MIPLDVFGSESVAADLPQQVCWRDGVTCSRCRSDWTVRNSTTERFSGISEGLRPHEPLEDDDAFVREYVVHGDGKYVDDEVHVNTCESHALLVRRRLSTYRDIP
jgi:transposase